MTLWMAVDFATIDKMAAETDSELLIDRNGWCFEFTKDRREAAKQVAEQVEKLQAEQKKNEKKYYSDFFVSLSLSFNFYS